MLPRSLPLFPLPDVVLFPNVFLPLHVFEPRYRAMVEDVLAGDRLIGMVLLKPGWEPDYDGRPPVYGVGCAGLVTHAERLPDGRFNLVLRGLSKFRISGERADQVYRVASVETALETLADADRILLGDECRRLEALLVTALEGSDARFPPTMPHDDLVNALAQYLPLEPLERQALLEQPGALARCRSLAELLEMKVLTADRPWSSAGVH
jgi:Lon protease-like protein